MTNRNPQRGKSLLQALKEMPADSSTKSLLVALGVALVCSLVISTAAVLLRPLQVANQQEEQQREIGAIVSLIPGIEQLMGTLEAPQLDTVVIEFSTGRVAPSIDPASYDPAAAANDPQQSIALVESEDLAGIQRRANFGLVHRVTQEGRVKLYILPVYGSGYASTIRGYLALAEDGNTVAALTFYEHGETPGIGNRIDAPEWRNQWPGKKVRDDQGRLRIDVAATATSPSSPEARYLVDGITGATRTSRGVGNLVRFWLGDYGYGPYLAQIRSTAPATSRGGS